MPAPDKIKELIERFERNIEAYKQGKYNETQTRREFIDPFFTELGWDVVNVPQVNLSSVVTLVVSERTKEETTIQRQIDTTDKQIDQLVYKLYNLTPEEIAIVEGGE